MEIGKLCQQSKKLYIGQHIAVTLNSGKVKKGYFSDYESEDDNDEADGIRLEPKSNEDNWGNGMLIPAVDILSIDTLEKDSAA